MQLASFQKTGKMILILVFLLGVLGATIFLGQQASSFFARASACPAAGVSAVQVTANSSVVSWETGDVSQGRVEYGTSATNLTFQAPEATSGKTHNVPLTLLTPNTVYYYLVTIGNNRCDSSGQSCASASCVPWTFTTSALTQQQQIVATLPVATPSATLVPPSPATNATGSATPTKGATTSATPVPTSALSAFCKQVQANLTANKDMTDIWPALKQYDIDGNGIVNGLDIIKCQQSGK